MFNFNTLKSMFSNNLRSAFKPSDETCIICSVPLASSESELPLCNRCFAIIPWIKPQEIQCPACGRYEDCPDCPRRTDPQFVCNRSAVRYDASMKDWLSRLKYRGDERLQLLFARMMGGVLERLCMEQKLKPKQIAALTYVPLSAVRLAERGFNQTELIARTLGAAYGIPVKPLLKRTRHTGKQSYKSRAERLQDLRGVFVTDPELAPPSTRLITPHIILVDDVYTTGSTLQECSRAIRQSLDVQIYGLTWAR